MEVNPPSSSREFLIRTAVAGDAPAVAGLSGELGYPADATAVSRRLKTLLTSPKDVILLGVRDGGVTGWIPRPLPPS